jgi:hypothetical protein
MTVFAPATFESIVLIGIRTAGANMAPSQTKPYRGIVNLGMRVLITGSDQSTYSCFD